jgi:hypothetical protein
LAKVFGARRVFDGGAREICERLIAGARWGNQSGGDDLLGIIYNEARMTRDGERPVLSPLGLLRQNWCGDWS